MFVAKLGTGYVVAKSANPTELGTGPSVRWLDSKGQAIGAVLPIHRPTGEKILRLSALKDGSAGTHLDIVTGVTAEVLINGTPIALVGAVIAYAANSIPSGYLLCNGAAVSRTTYSRLFGVIGTIYGAGDGICV